MNRRDLRAQKKARRRNRALTGISLSLVAGLALATGAGTAAVAMTNASSAVTVTDLEQELFGTVLPELREQHELAAAAIAATHEEVDAARAVLADSDGKTLTEEEREALAAVVAEARVIIEAAERDLARSKAAHVDVLSVPSLSDLDLAYAVETLASSPARTVIVIDTESHIEGVNEAVIAWEAEQARLAAEQAAAEEAARAAAAAAAQNRGSSSSSPSRPGETREQRVNRLVASLPFSFPGAVQYWNCASVHSQALACYKDGVIYMTPRGLSRSDCSVRGSLAHEWRHWWQHQNGKFELSADGTRYLNAEWLEADARAFAAPYGC